MTEKAEITLRPLTADRELKLPARAGKLKPYLLSQGLSLPDAEALAFNAALASLITRPPLSPKKILARFSLEEIAEICERCCEEGLS